MEWYYIVLITVACAVAVSGIAAIFGYFGYKKKRTKLVVTTVPNEDVEAEGAAGTQAEQPPKIIRVEEVPLEEIETDRLCEIEDPDVNSRVRSLVPELVKTEVSAGAVVNLCSKTVTKIILPASTKLGNAAAGGGMSLFSSASAGAAMAAGQVGALIASSITSVMSAASMVVGQYYMTRVSMQLKKIGESISRMGSFQDNEYRSKVFALNAQVRKSASFRAEIIESRELREAEIAKLNNFEHECIELLGQADLMVGDCAKKTDLNYEQYIRTVADIQNWFVSQKILLEMLSEIADLKFALHLGAASREQCDALLPIYTEQATESQQLLSGWHVFITDKLGIELKESRRKRRGVDRAVHWLPGLIKKDLKFRAMPDATVTMIEEQISGDVPAHVEGENLFDTDVELIAIGDKLYYLPSSVEVVHDGHNEKFAPHVGNSEDFAPHVDDSEEPKAG